MTKEQTRRDSQISLTEKSPPSEKVPQGKSSVVSWKNLAAIISDGLDINPPSPNASEVPEKLPGKLKGSPFPSCKRFAGGVVVAA